MGNRHLSLETMAKWLTGRLEHDDLLREVVPHHLEQCPGCRQTYETLEILKQEVGHWDEEVALLETREAQELAALLDHRPPDERADLIEQEESLHTWGLCQLLLGRSLAAARQDPGSAFDMADQAVRLTAHLGSAYDPQWVLGLRARALACRANARRVLGELRCWGKVPEEFRRVKKSQSVTSAAERPIRGSQLFPGRTTIAVLGLGAQILPSAVAGQGSLIDKPVRKAHLTWSGV